MGKIDVWKKIDGELLLTTNGFSQGVSVGKKNLQKSYWYYLAEKIASHTKNKRGPSVLWLGVGAGTGPQILNSIMPRIIQTGIEFDETILQIAYDYFSLQSIPIKVINADAYKEILSFKKKKQFFDAIVIDIYINDSVENGEHLSRHTFLRNVFDIVERDGIILINRLAHKKDEQQRTEQLRQYLQKTYKNADSLYIQDPRGYKNEVITIVKN